MSKPRSMYRQRLADVINQGSSPSLETRRVGDANLGGQGALNGMYWSHLAPNAAARPKLMRGAP